ncbi:hypothetical protein C7S16_3006 [Burkholderia thailandensis]|uniref:Uncharacterized protein n=1 Tax=Burkholderia thailandensis TaxID=57975 RepID=A0AAW9D119_BURTH|nr:hypothetical protein [Burkholderia thailandensis]MDW9255616.1 hypothetical protein [Burkholderia thailandensis]
MRRTSDAESGAPNLEFRIANIEPRSALKRERRDPRPMFRAIAPDRATSRKPVDRYPPSLSARRR